ncbi:MAG: hypothetical protein GY823_13775 [Flavobacteriaceae bacterium]|nr:hypothetical protein [Flavobacteriaceae bacterium]
MKPEMIIIPEQKNFTKEEELLLMSSRFRTDKIDIEIPRVNRIENQKK